MNGFVIAGVVIGFLLVAVGAFFLNAWLLMLVAGGLFPVFGWHTISYGTAMLLALFFSLVGGSFKGVNYASSRRPS